MVRYIPNMFQKYQVKIRVESVNIYVKSVVYQIPRTNLQWIMSVACMRGVSGKYINDPIGIVFPNKSAISVIVNLNSQPFLETQHIYTHITLKVYMFWGVWQTNGYWVSSLGRLEMQNHTFSMSLQNEGPEVVHSVNTYMVVYHPPKVAFFTTFWNHEVLKH